MEERESRWDGVRECRMKHTFIHHGMCARHTHTGNTHSNLTIEATKHKKWLRFLVSVKLNLVENATSLHNSYFESENLHVHSEWNAGPCAGSTLYSNLMDI